MHELGNDVLFVACVTNAAITFAYYLDLSNFLWESGLSYFRVLSMSLLFVPPVCLFCECCRMLLLLFKPRLHVQFSLAMATQWTILLKEAASLLWDFYRDPLWSLTLLSLNVLIQKP